MLRHADEQSIACVAAVLHAINAHRLGHDGPGRFRDWGVVAAPRFIGRDSLARDVPDFKNEGPWGVSPHVIPHRSLHSPSGAVSVALGIHGPNLGAGGGPGHEAEGLLAALSLLWGGLPGVWLLISRIEPLTDTEAGKGAIPAGTAAVADAIALVPGVGLTLTLAPSGDETSPRTPGPAAQGVPFSLRALLTGGPCVLPGVGTARLSAAAACRVWAEASAPQLAAS
jgi:hypothetical protein